MSSIDTIKNAILIGVESAFSDMYMFTDKIGSRVNAEYLFTVNVAKEIAKKNNESASPYSINIEQPTKIFNRNCFYPVKYQGLLKKSTLLNKFYDRVSRNGRIDITVYEDKNNNYIGKQPVCAIELKGMNPKRTVVVKDLKRNAEWLNIISNTGNSVLECTFFSAVHSYENAITKQGITGNENELKAKYQKWLLGVDNLSGIDIDIITKTISNETLGTVYYEADELAIDKSTCHHFVIVMIILQPSQKP